MNETIKTEEDIAGRTRCEVWSRICGYLRPIQQWNEGKESEFNDRKMFQLE
jgi:ribonucleoside-triphosphate reductase